MRPMTATPQPAAERRRRAGLPRCACVLGLTPRLRAEATAHALAAFRAAAAPVNRPEGEHATTTSLMDPGKRRELVLQSSAKYFGSRALEPVEYMERDWSAEEYSRGCYGGRMGTGV